MKRLQTLWLLFVICVCSASAQIGDGESGIITPIQKKGKAYNYELSIGVQAAGGVSMMSEGDGLSVYDGSSMSFGGGAALNVRFGGKDSRNRDLHGQGLLGVGLELNYRQHTVKTLGQDDLKLGYFEVPFMVQLYPLYNGKHLRNFYIEAGPTFAGTLSSKPDVLTVGNTSYRTGDIKGFDIKASVGLGYRFNEGSANDGFYVNARYNFGTSDLAGNFPAKISTAEITIGYMFKCIGSKR